MATISLIPAGGRSPFLKKSRVPEEEKGTYEEELLQGRAGGDRKPPVSRKIGKSNVIGSGAVRPEHVNNRI